MSEGRAKLFIKGNPDRSFRVRFLLHELEIPFDLHVLDTANDEHLSADFLALNPRGKVPVLILPDGKVLIESGAIVVAMADAHPEKGLAPAIDAPQRADYLAWCFFACTSVEQAWLRLRTARAGENAELVTQSEAIAKDAVDAVGATLGDGPYLFGDKLSAADCALGYGLTLLSRCPYAVEDNPRVRQYLADVSKRWESHGLKLELKRPAE